jgi:drug/metabolite transporter (DMT)-like permease
VQHPSPAALSITYALLASTLWGTADFFGGLATRRAAAFLVVAIAHGSSLIAASVYAFASHAAAPSLYTMLFGLAAGLAGGIGLMFFFAALAAGEMGITAAVSGVVTASVPVIFSFITAAPPGRVQLAGFGVALAGIWLIAYSPGSAPSRRKLGGAAVAGIAFGSMLILLRQADGGALWPLIFSRVGSCGVAILVCLVAWLRRRGRAAPVKTPWYVLVPLAALSGLVDAGGNFCYTTAALIGRLDVAAVLSSLYPAVTILLAAWLLRERTRKSQAWGMALALCAVVLIAI